MLKGLRHHLLYAYSFTNVLLEIFKNHQIAIKCDSPSQSGALDLSYYIKFDKSKLDYDPENIYKTFGIDHIYKYPSMKNKRTEQEIVFIFLKVLALDLNKFFHSTQKDEILNKVFYWIDFQKDDILNVIKATKAYKRTAMVNKFFKNDISKYDRAFEVVWTQTKNILQLVNQYVDDNISTQRLSEIFMDFCKEMSKSFKVELIKNRSEIMATIQYLKDNYPVIFQKILNSIYSNMFVKFKPKNKMAMLFDIPAIINDLLIFNTYIITKELISLHDNKIFRAFQSLIVEVFKEHLPVGSINKVDEYYSQFVNYIEEYLKSQIRKGNDEAMIKFFLLCHNRERYKQFLIINNQNSYTDDVLEKYFTDFRMNVYKGFKECRNTSNKDNIFDTNIIFEMTLTIFCFAGMFVASSLFSHVVSNFIMFYNIFSFMIFASTLLIKELGKGDLSYWCTRFFYSNYSKNTLIRAFEVGNIFETDIEKMSVLGIIFSLIAHCSIISQYNIKQSYISSSNLIFVLPKSRPNDVSLPIFFTFKSLVWIGYIYYKMSPILLILLFLFRKINT